MKKLISRINLLLKRHKLSLDEDVLLKYVQEEHPIRSELFSADQMRSHGKMLASSHELSKKKAADYKLLSRLVQNEKILFEVRTMLSNALKEKNRITPAGEWLLDNFYLIEEQIRIAQRHLPKGYSRELPVLKNGASAGLPRVYDLALETISHGDGRVDIENLSSFIKEYQTISTLKLGELWAIPILLRLALIENLRRVALRIASDMVEQNQAGYWADRMIETAEKEPVNLILAIAEMVESDPPMVSSFIAEFARRLQGQSLNLSLPLTWVEQRLSESGLTINHLVQSEIQQQAADQVSMSNSIGSLRFLGAMDWHEFVETMSVVNHTLGKDPAGFFKKMDFGTRDLYRHVIEKIAKKISIPEIEVAQNAIDLSKKASEEDVTVSRKSHVGYFLVDKGRSQLEKISGVPLTFSSAIKKTINRFPFFFYAGSISLLTFLFTLAIILNSPFTAFNSILFPLFIFLIATGVSHIAVSLVNQGVSFFSTPQPLPRLDFSEGIPSDARTITVVPSMLVSLESIDHLVEALEIKYLANIDENLFFALLTDFADGDKEVLPADEILLNRAQMKIEELNELYGDADGDKFFLFHRPRLWNPKEKVWMGYERKRGKINDLNAYLRGSDKNMFSLIVGENDLLLNVKYVITLDTDTQLPRDSARKFIEVMAHPLNRPVYDEEKGRIIQGYGIIQPGIAVLLHKDNSSQYARLCGSEAGIDPYTRTVSNVYQDLFGEGSFVGKGIYDIDAFDISMKDQFPENLILSHDLIEGCFARSGLLSDVPLIEENPSSYIADTNRRRRWIRGDWQITKWIFPFFKTTDGSVRRNKLSALSKWKIIDNLRRSLVAPSLLLLMFYGWAVSTNPWFWTIAVIGILFLSPFVFSIISFFRKDKGVLLSQHISSSSKSMGRSLGETLFFFITLPFEAYYSLEAIIKTLWRLLVSRNHLLEWNTKADRNRAKRKSIFGFYITMISGPLLSIIFIAYLILAEKGTILLSSASLPFLFLWFLSPALAWYLSRPLKKDEIKFAALASDKQSFLLTLSRKIWAFFEEFMGPEDNWLPPDNYQESPVEVIAHRTSPTNMGLALLSNVTAWDFAYITGGELIERTSLTLDSMNKLPRYEGHFYNWYDTLTMEPMQPQYVSTVDSGNLAAYLLILKTALLEMIDSEIMSTRLFSGIRDTVKVLKEKLGKLPLEGFTDLKDKVEKLCSHNPNSIKEIRNNLQELIIISTAMVEKGAPVSKKNNSPDINWWINSIQKQCKKAIDEINEFIPWSNISDLQNTFIDLDTIPTLRNIAEINFDQLNITGKKDISKDEIEAFKDIKNKALNRIKEIEKLAELADELSWMNFDFLYNKDLHLLAIGYNVSDHRRDTNYYDLLASEARLCSFVAIAQGQLPQENWFALGRQLTTAGGDPVLLSWSGSMFEYLMPLLIMPEFKSSLLGQTYKTVIKRQIEYGKQRNVPWGLSESGYYLIDTSLNYQYRAFGVPGLGLKRGLADDLVIAPYASALALMVDPIEACKNLQRLTSEGFGGKYGLYEAIDYSLSRVPHGEAYSLVQSYMVHHQGMSLLSLSFLILDRPMQRRFNAEPFFASAALLLQERIPKARAFYSHTTELPETQIKSAVVDIPVRLINNYDTIIPEVQFLSNGRYRVMITNSGGGYSCWNDLALTRWRVDSTRDNSGSFCYIRDVESGAFWSTTFQPVLKKPDRYEVVFSEGKAEFRRSDMGIDTYTAIVVSPEDDVEIRRTRILNRSRKKRMIELTTYSEVVVSPGASDAQHPAFGNLFVQTEINRDLNAVLCHRRPRSEDEKTPWFFQLVTLHGTDPIDISYETDRSVFIGRWKSTAAPAAMTDYDTLSGKEGSVLDPIIAIRYRIILNPDESATFDIISGIGENRSSALQLIGKYHDRLLAKRAFDLSWTHSQVMLRQINVREADAQIYCRLGGAIIFPHSTLRAKGEVIASNNQGQPGLWGYSISGDVPIVLLKIENTVNIEIVRQMIQAHKYWRLKGLVVDLVIWNEEYTGYRQLLNEQILDLISTVAESNISDGPGSIFVRSTAQISIEDRILIQSTAHIIISDTWGTLSEQLNSRVRKIKSVKPLDLFLRKTKELLPEPALPRPDLLFFNGYGGFTPDGKEYIITTAQGQVPPAPWINVIANKNFGTVVSESGMSYTWAENAHEFRLTPWSNDPVSDTGGEAFYIRDEERGHFWSPMPLPCQGQTPYVTRHGFGYTVFEHVERGIKSEAWVYVALEANVKFIVIKLKNISGRGRKLSLTGYAEWVLGDIRSKTTMHVVTELDSDSGALLARNGYSNDFPGRVAFFDTDEKKRTISGDRLEFLGRNGQMQNPDAMTRKNLSGRIGAALDPCAAIQVAVTLEDNQEKEIIFRLGVGHSKEDATSLIKQFRGSYAARSALEDVWKYWDHTLGAVQIETPDLSLNTIANGWLLYQTLACRVWGRSGFYQSGGAFGFRDQLQDVMALVHTNPDLLREHILLYASRQFTDGDVQHWWHPPSGRGVRTKCSDDFLWLPLAVTRYVLTTGDSGVLDETRPYLTGRLLNIDEESYFDLPGISHEAETIYEHCKKAIIHGQRYGIHGLPLIGSGDWNDGMNTVGKDGKGESIWLGFFLYAILKDFKEIALIKKDEAFYKHCIDEASKLQQNLEQNGWDGEWYRRAYCDNGTALGSSINDECMIDSIAQSWSVLSEAGEKDRTLQAMDSLEKHLVDREHGLVKLLDPPFDKSDINPGYIKGYVPGVRENGGQYTHAAVWAAMAFAKIGDTKRAWELTSMLNPINHGSTEEDVAVYKVEPYVMAADIYSCEPHAGRGGWTWYTGSAGWMYRLIIESILGLRREIDKLYIDPRIPEEWDSFKIYYRYYETSYNIEVKQVSNELENNNIIIKKDGVLIQQEYISLVNDNQEHRIEVIISI